MGGQRRPIPAIVARYGEGARPVIIAGFRSSTQTWDEATQPIRVSRATVTRLWRAGYGLLRVRDDEGGEQLFETTSLL